MKVDTHELADKVPFIFISGLLITDDPSFSPLLGSHIPICCVKSALVGNIVYKFFLFLCCKISRHVTGCK